MGGDYTRLTFRPREDHSGVLMQQGRVQLDADWNELVELIDRRWRAETVDVVGRAVVPSETPDGFRIEATGGTLTIGRGRIYVDGLLAENHGAPPLEYDPVLGELRGQGALPYGDQPYFPDPPTLPGGGPHLVYLDVWEREVTYIEEPDLLEKAIGVDTATRLQTVWQVRLVENVEDSTCGAGELPAPSAGRLTTAAVGVPAPDDPCIVPPAGGYRGTENRLYRVEIHDPGAQGTATFKWSRDNGSIATPVTAIDASRTELTVVRIGRDAVRRLNVDDWVEITDDYRELAGLAGELRKVADVDEARQTVTLDAALPSGAFDATDPDRHTRVRRWDQRGAQVDAGGGVLTVPAAGPPAPIVLEDGVEITFDADAAGGEFRVGDYWAFAARTADASVEELVREPPRGITHHYCRLAVVTFPGDETDCRSLWPPMFEDAGCDCSVCVTAESHNGGTLTIQQAIDLVKGVGGKVCLGAGLYRLDRGLRIVGARSLRIEGKGYRTVLEMRRAREPAIAIERSLQVTISDLAVVTSPGRKAERSFGGTAVALRNTLATTIERCALVQTSFLARATALFAGSDVFEESLAATRAAGGPLVAFDGLVVQTLLRENVLVGTTGVGALLTRFRDSLGELRPMDTGERIAVAAGDDDDRSRYVLTYNLLVEENLFACQQTGVSLEGFSVQAGDTRIGGNSLLGCGRGGIVATGVVPPRSRLDVASNLLQVLGAGIVVGTDDTRVAANDVTGLLRRRSEERRATGDGIVLAASLRPAGIDRCQVLSNRLLGLARDGVAIRTHVVSGLVKQNQVQGVGGGGIVMDPDASAEVLTVENNQVLDAALTADDDRQQVATGIALVRTREAVVVENSIAGVGRQATAALRRTGIEILGSSSARIAGNDVVDIGPPDEFAGGAAGIAVGAPFDRLDVYDNLVRRARDAPRDPGRAEWYAVYILSGRDVTEGHRHFAGAVADLDEAMVILGRARLARLPRGRALVGIRGNQLDAYGAAPAVESRGDGVCVLGENRCLLRAPGPLPTVRIAAGAAIANANYVEGPGDAAALVLDVPGGAVTVLGNIATGPVEVNGAALGAPWAALNVP